jgi:hypothetical protein
MRQPGAESRAPLDGEGARLSGRAPPGRPGLKAAPAPLNSGDKAPIFSFSFSVTRGDLLSVFVGELARLGDLGSPGEPGASARLVLAMAAAPSHFSASGIMTL